MHSPPTLNATIREARKAAHITLRGLAARLGISAALLSAIEHGDHVPPSELIVRLAHELGGDADRWCGLAGKLTPVAERDLARCARADPKFFRSMVERMGGGR